MKINSIKGMVGLAVLVLALSACSKKKHIDLPTLPDGTELVDPGRINIGLTGMDSAPAGTRINIYAPNATVDNSGNLIPLLAVTPATPIDLSAGTYTLLAIVPPATGGMETIALGLNPQGEITVELSTAGTRTTSEEISGIELPPAPGVIAATATATVVKNASVEFDLTPQHITRCLALSIKTQGMAASDIASINATLHGVLNRLPAGADGNGAGTTTTLYHTTIALGATTPQQWTATLRLLGADTAATQLLRIDVELKSGTITTFYSDATALMAAFNTMPAGEALEMEATVSFGIGGMDATITDWTLGWNEGGDGV